MDICSSLLSFMAGLQRQLVWDLFRSNEMDSTIKKGCNIDQHNYGIYIYIYACAHYILYIYVYIYTIVYTLYIILYIINFNVYCQVETWGLHQQ